MGEAQPHVTLEAARRLLLAEVGRIDAVLDELRAGLAPAATLEEAVAELLRREVRTWRPSEVVDALRRDGLDLPARAHQRVRSVLARLVVTGDAVRVSNGHYEAPQEFPAGSPRVQGLASGASEGLPTVTSTPNIPGG
ncbi:MAG TPA: hypothetical protein VM938_05605 [Acidimicrobiales bacterium]|nr:hypothetical protein [Acidimicrobiales bacterium]